MRIKDITIENFRGFSNRSFEFDSKMNVILGNNTTGKTTLLHAVQIALGAYLQELTLISGCSRNFKDSDQVMEYNESSKSFHKHPSKPAISVKASFVDGIFNNATRAYDSHELNICWKRTSSKNSRKNCGELMDAVSKMENIRRNSDETGKTSVFPIMLSFGASRLENNYNGAEKTKARASREEKAYKCALDEKVDFKSAFDWIYRFDKEFDKGREFEGTNIAFLNALITAIPALKEVEIDTKNSEFNAKIQMTSDPNPYWLTYDMMSAGFKAMINIVAEIAHRCIKLNGFLGEDAVTNTPGIIMIDEVDLYLHPHWQQHVLEDLQKAFPLMQFIVTTHSPFIVQSVESNNVITLDVIQNNSESPKNRGIEEIASYEMGMKDELKSIKYRKQLELASKYFSLVNEGRASKEDITKVRKELNDLELEFELINDPAFEAFLRLNRGNL